ncbi:hypothetical protein SPI_02207 [Niveomyces insectorum RCEF 264]|uniref:Uncharacterized protein n=1 Tax=Niveomyces insectorum RCEF 264 TaxID=1081102 RepID=A0A162MQU8_9HYPO|nr:hypothetical protein SPI_02207 [Niveomyces insectorum RCEF 264]
MEGQDPPDHVRSEDKGKGKEKEKRGDKTDDEADKNITTANAASSSTNDAESSVFTRIARSAAGLGRAIVAGPPDGRDLAAVISTDKGGSSSARLFTQTPAAQEQEHLPEHRSPAQALGPTPYSNNNNNHVSAGFTRGHTHQHIAEQEAAFAQFLDDTVPVEFPVGKDDVTTHGPFDAAGLASRHAAATTTTTTTTSRRQEPPLSAVATQEQRDGQAVVDHLLATADSFEPEPNYVQEMELAEDELAGLRRVLFGAGGRGEAPGFEPPVGVSATNSTASGSVPEWGNVLNFVPDFARWPPPATTSAAGLATASRESSSRAILGVDPSAAATRLWLDQWHNVLTHYDDVVWGGLAPLVAKARAEVDQLRAAAAQAPGERAPTNAHATPTPSTARALDRLRQILGHLRAAD